MRPGGEEEISSASSHDGSSGRCLPIAQNFPCPLPIAQNFPCPLLLRACTYKRGHWSNVRSCGFMLQDDFAHPSAQIDSRSGVNAHGSVAPAFVARRRLIEIVDSNRDIEWAAGKAMNGLTLAYQVAGWAWA